MVRVTYISIQNFKIFENNIKIELTNPTVLVGPNNSGKTSVLQAFALWSLGIKAWKIQKGNSKGRIRYGIPINRLNLYQLPVQNARFLWNKCEVRKGSTEPIVVTISLGLDIDNKVYDCPIEFTQNNSELIYCKPTGILIENSEVLEAASTLQVNLLYSMSGIAIEEEQRQAERVNYLMGQGMTSEVLRNLCYTISSENPEDWKRITDWMDKLFNMKILKPQLLPSGLLSLTYKHHSTKKPLDIASAGRGALQILLLLSYMYSHKSSVILVDEPDAHLEIIKQKTVYALLNDVANINSNQLVIATHSEVVLNEAVDNSISMILDGEVKTISNKKNDISPVLKEFGIEHYYKASITHNVLYVEGSTDILMLKAFARLLNRERAINILEGELNCYYTQNPCNDDNIENIIDRKEGYYNPVFVRHFTALKKMIPSFVGLGIFDSDAKGTEVKGYPADLTVYKWKKYEIENYFVSLNILDTYFTNYLGGSDTIYYGLYLKAKKETITKFIFDGNEEQYETFINSPMNSQELLWSTVTKDKKMSKFLDILMDEFVESSALPYPMRKGDYYKLISYMSPDEVNDEIVTVLELVENKLSSE